MNLRITDERAEALKAAASQGPFHLGGIADPLGHSPTTWAYGPAAKGMQSGRQVASNVPTEIAPLFVAAPDLLADRADMLAEIARLRGYVGAENMMSDYRTAAEMRAALDAYRAALTTAASTVSESSREVGTLMGILDVIMLHGVDPKSKPVREAVDEIRKRWEAGEKPSKIAGE